MIELTEDPIDVTKLLAAISDATCGGQVLFVGTTRQWTRRTPAETPVDAQTPNDLQAPVDSEQLETDYLFYEAYREMALGQMSDLADRACEQWPIKKVAIVHRLGRVDPQEASVAVAVSSPHRREAFEAAHWLIDELKHEVPIWKQEHYVQNAAEWIHPTSGSCSCVAKIDGSARESNGEIAQGQSEQTSQHAETGTVAGRQVSNLENGI